MQQCGTWRNYIKRQEI